VIVLLEFKMPTVQDKEIVESFVREIKMYNETCIGTNHVDDYPYEIWLKSCQDAFKGNIKDKVPFTIFLVLKDHKLVGFINIRHFLNDELLHDGGHIGYMVRPTERKKGYAKLILKYGLSYLKKYHDVERVLVTCRVDNVASEKTILSQGGIYENTVNSLKHGLTKRFWIHLH
jgi:predicted acetyltransferase